VRSSKTIHVISAHAEGEVGDVIVGGVSPPPGETIWEQSRWIARDQTLRNFVLNEPRGGVFRHVNLLVPPKHPDAHTGWIIMEPEDTPPMSGSNAICVATVLLDADIIPMTEPETTLTLEAPGGLVRVRARCRDGKAERIFVQNVPSFAAELDQTLTVEGLGALTVDTAYGGDSFVVVDAEALGLSLVEPDCTTWRQDHGRGQRATTLSPPRKSRLDAFLFLSVCWSSDTGARWSRVRRGCRHSTGQSGSFADRNSPFCPHGVAPRTGGNGRW